MILQVGYISRAHGLKGDVTVTLTTNRTAERTAPGAVFLREGGSPLVVEKAQLHKEGKWIVRFEGVNTREAAEALRGTELTAEAIEDPDDVFVHEVIGKTMVEPDGTERGEVISVLSNPASDLMELDSGRLVPMVFYVSHDETTVTVDVPDGLWDL